MSAFTWFQWSCKIKHQKLETSQVTCFSVLWIVCQRANQVVFTIGFYILLNQTCQYCVFKERFSETFRISFSSISWENRFFFWRKKLLQDKTVYVSIKKDKFCIPFNNPIQIKTPILKFLGQVLTDLRLIMFHNKQKYQYFQKDMLYLLRLFYCRCHLQVNADANTHISCPLIIKAYLFSLHINVYLSV